MEVLRELSEVSAVPRASRKRRTSVCVSGIEVGGIEDTSQVVKRNGVRSDQELGCRRAGVESDPGHP
jgi:hypothetical protein